MRRAPVLTYYQQHPPAVGLPWEDPQLVMRGERALVLTDFVDRVGDPVDIVASDGSGHRGETVLADTLQALTRLASRGRPWPDVAAVTYPAHWRPQSVNALRHALGRVPGWSWAPIRVLSDVEAAVTALQQDPGLPSRGVIALCDFGGSGTSITLIDATNGYQPIGSTVRHLDFSGDLIDQALLTRVIGDLAGAGAVGLASTSAIGSLTKLRTECRGAKERLSANTVTALPVTLPGYHGEVRLTRVELDEAMRAPLSAVVDVIDDVLRRNGIKPADLAAVATVGGGAATVSVTTTLSAGLRVPVITSARPGLAAATGAALRALRGPADDSATALSPTTAVLATASVPAPAPEPEPAEFSLAWSQVDDMPELMPETDFANSLTGARPQLEFIQDPESAAAEGERVPWYRRTALVMATAAVGLLAAVGGIGVALTSETSRGDSSEASTVTPAIPGVTEVIPAPQPFAAQPPPAPQVQNPPPAPIRTVTAPAPVTRTQVVRATVSEPPPPPPTTTTPPATTTAPAPTTTTPPPVTETVTETVPPPSTEALPPSVEAPPTAEPDLPVVEPDSPPVDADQPVTDPRQWIPPMPTIPGLPPFVPQSSNP